MSSSLGFDMFNTFNQGVLNIPTGVGLPVNFYAVPEKFRNIQDAINTAVAEGRNGADPAVIFINPNDSNSYTENLVLHDGVYLMSAVPNVPVMISGQVSFGTNNADLNGRYMLQDLNISTAEAGTLLDSGLTMTTAQVTLVRCDLTHTGVLLADVCVFIRATAGVSTWVFDNCNLSAVGLAIADFALAVQGNTHSVTLQNNSTLTVSGAAVDVCLYVNTGSTVNVLDSTLNGLVWVGVTVASNFNATRSTFNVNNSTVGTAVVEVVGAFTSAINLTDVSVNVSDATVLVVALNTGGAAATLTMDRVGILGVATSPPLIPASGFLNANTRVSNLLGTALITVAYTITEADHNRILMFGASPGAGTLITLPAVSASNAGLTVECLFRTVDADSWVIQSPAATMSTVILDTSGGAGSCTQLSSTITIAIAATQSVYIKLVSHPTGWFAFGGGVYGAASLIVA